MVHSSYATGVKSGLNEIGRLVIILIIGNRVPEFLDDIDSKIPANKNTISIQKKDLKSFPIPKLLEKYLKKIGMI